MNENDKVLAGKSLERRLPTVSSRLHPPLASPYEILRPKVCDQIFTAGGARLVLITAPAGFGKTTVMRQVLQRCESSGLASAWLNVEAADNDVIRFLASLMAALQPVMPGLASAEEGSAFDADSGRFVERLLERIGRQGEPFVLFLDDFEVIQSAAVLSIVRQIIRSLPKAAQLVIGSRNMPDLGLASLRAHGWLLEVDPTQLRFTEQEVHSFLCTSRALDLRDEEIKRLHARTEGWAAGLWLASLALGERAGHGAGGNRAALDEFIAVFSGSDAAIADYLAEDVLAHLDADMQDFLLRTSILSPLSAAACDAVCGRTDSQLMLERLERGNLFLVRLDDQRRQYRYHGLFSEFLRGQLLRQRPDAVPGLHRAAADWYEAQGRPVPAIDHALASGDLAHALPLLAAHALALLSDGRMGLLTRWLGGVPAASLQAFPGLCVIYGWAINFTRGPREALTLIGRIDERAALDDESAAALHALKTVLLLRVDSIEQADELGRAHFNRLLMKPSFASSVLATALGTIAIMRGNFSDAQVFLDQAKRLQPPFSGGFSIMLSESIEGAIDVLRGNLRQAIARSRGTVEPRSNAPARYAKGNALGGVLLAEALYEADERAEAERLIAASLSTITEGGLPDQLITAHVIMARILALRGDYDQAFHLVMDLEYLGHQLALPRVVCSAKLERARLALAADNLDSAQLELNAAADPAVWARTDELFTVANDADTHAIGSLRFAIRSGRAAEALVPLAEQLKAAEAAGRMRRALKLQILLAEAMFLTNDRKQAVAVFGNALAFGAQQGFVRSFVDEGSNIVKLLQEWTRVNGPELAAVPRDYIARLLQSAGEPVAEPAAAAEASDAIEALSRKEIVVLRHLADGLSNRALAEALFLSETTIRSHLRNINAKLGVHSRMQAIIVARKHGLIA